MLTEKDKKAIFLDKKDSKKNADGFMKAMVNIKMLQEEGKNAV